jgi:3-phenylpropionate/trans-cinnamate dioxygenase ferredoxin component
MSGRSEQQLVDVGALDDIEPGTAVRVDVDGRRIALVRIDDAVYAIGDRCTHADVSLAEGDVDAAERTIECWRHGSQFSLETGEPLSLPATKPTPTYDVVVRDGRILLGFKP